MDKIRLIADADYTVGTIDPHLFGSFIEPFGRCIYGGVYEPGHPTADADGYRGDVLAETRALGIPIVRFPGGKFVEGHHWRDAIGPRENRPRRLDLAWYSTETNQFGTDEYIGWCRRAGVEPMLTVNMGTGTLRDAAELVEYCNHPGGTVLSELRRANGADKPHNVRYWCLGNERDNLRQVGYQSPEDYAKAALETAKIMRFANGEAARAADAPEPLKLLVCGSSGPFRESFPDWDRLVLEETYDFVDYLSIHYFYPYTPDNASPDARFYAGAMLLERFLDTARSTLEVVRAKRKTDKRVYLSLDEWNVWTARTPRTEPLWKVAPAIEETVYHFRDVPLFAGLIHAMLHHCDVLRIGCFAQLCNVLAPIRTETGGRLLRQAIYYPFRTLANAMRGEVVRTVTNAPRIASDKGDYDSLNTAVAHDRAARTVMVSLCSFAEEDRELTLSLCAFGDLVPVSHIAMTHEDPEAANTFENPEAVVPHDCDLPTPAAEGFTLTLPAKSWSFLTFRY